MTRNRSSRRAAVLAVPALLAGLLLTGCDPSTPGAAAIVGGHRVPIQEVQDDTLAFLDVVPGAVSESDAQLFVLQREVYSLVLARVAKDAGVTVSQTEIDRDKQVIFASTDGATGLIQQLAQSQQPEVLAPQQVDEWVRDRILFAKIAEKLGGGRDQSSPQVQQEIGDAITKAAAALRIQINPRYGRWDPERGVVAEISGGLSKTVEELSGTPSPGAS